MLLRNTEKRVKELTAFIDLVLERGSLGHQEALSLRGRMQFAKSQFWGRSARLCLAAVTSHAYSSNCGSLNVHLISCLKAFRFSLENSRPREITAAWDSPLFLFTDASFCPSELSWPCGLGGVLVDSLGNQLAAMSACLSLEDLRVLGYPEKSTVIFEAELLAIIVCLKLWRRALKGRPCVIYVDNNSARDVSISGSARSAPGDLLVLILLASEDACHMNAFYARVPSESNIADNPSRNSLDGITPKIVSPDLVLVVARKILKDVVHFRLTGDGPEKAMGLVTCRPEDGSCDRSK